MSKSQRISGVHMKETRIRKSFGEISPKIGPVVYPCQIMPMTPTGVTVQVTG